MLIECRCNPWMRELQERGAPGREEKRRLAIDAPGDRVGAEDAFDRIFYPPLRGGNMQFEGLTGDSCRGSVVTEEVIDLFR